MKRLIVYAGANGAGKSSLRAGGSDPVDVEIDPDRIARAINPANPRSVDLAAGKEALRQFDRTIAQGQSLSLETTLSGRSILTRMQAAKTAGYTVELRYVGLDTADMNVGRVNARAGQGGHFIAEGDVRRRAVSSLDNLPAALAIANQATVLDNSGPTHRTVLAIENRRVVFQATDMPRWLGDRLPRIAAALTTPMPASQASTALRFDPFGDSAITGHLRNRIGTNDLAEVARLEAGSLTANILPALDALKASRRLTYGDVLATHRRLFDAVYPWAGQDRATLSADTPNARLSSLFSIPGRAQPQMDAALRLGSVPNIMRSRPGEVFGRLAQAHPFLDGNGRVAMTVHADLARRADIHIDWSQITKPSFMSALARELRDPGSALDTLLRPHVNVGTLQTLEQAKALIGTFTKQTSSPAPTM